MNKPNPKNKGLTRSNAPRPKKILRDNIQGVSNPALKRLSLKAGVARLDGETYDTVRSSLREFLDNILKDAVIVKDHAKRKTLMVQDIKYALDRQGITYYG